MSDDEHPATLDEAAKIEQERLWSDLTQAVRTSHRGCWSIQCEDLTWRIINLARLVGATSWSAVDVSLLRSGVYEKILTDAGIGYEPIDWDAVVRTEAVILAGLR